MKILCTIQAEAHIIITNTTDIFHDVYCLTELTKYIMMRQNIEDLVKRIKRKVTTKLFILA